MKQSKYLGNVYDGRWKVIKAETRTITLENIYNQEKMEIDRSIFIRVDRKQTTISNIRTCRIYHNDNNFVDTPKAIKRRDYQAYRRLNERGN